MRIFKASFSCVSILAALCVAAMADGPASVDQSQALHAVQMDPSSDEAPFDGEPNYQTDKLLDCYDKFRGSLPQPGSYGPPHITQSRELGFILRADFKPPVARDASLGRLVCSKNGAATALSVALPPLDASLSAPPDANAARAITHQHDSRKIDDVFSSHRFAPPDKDTVALLEGIWLQGQKPDGGPCTSNSYGGKPQIEFDFQKTGGRALIFEPPDLFTAVRISGIEKAGDRILIQGERRDGTLARFLSIRVLAHDELEFLPPKYDGSKEAEADVKVAYRCGDPDRSVGSSLSLAQLSMLTPPVSGSFAFPAEIEGISDADLCSGNIGQILRSKGISGADAFREKSIQFEVLGPDHYFIFAWGFMPEHKLIFDYVRSIEAAGEHTLKLHMQEHLEKGDGWDVAESRGKLYDLTVIDHGDHIEIPELATSFARCDAHSPTSVGLHR